MKKLENYIPFSVPDNPSAREKPSGPANPKRFTVPDKPETDNPQKEVVVLGHCLLNPHCKSKRSKTGYPY